MKSAVLYGKENSVRFFWTASAISMMLIKYMVSSSPLITFEFMFLAGLLTNMLYIQKQNAISGKYIVRITGIRQVK